LQPTDWGWKVVDGQMVPVQLTLHLLQGSSFRSSDATAKRVAAHRDAYARSMDLSAHQYVVIARVRVVPAP